MAEYNAWGSYQPGAASQRGDTWSGSSTWQASGGNSWSEPSASKASWDNHRSGSTWDTAGGSSSSWSACDATSWADKAPAIKKLEWKDIQLVPIEKNFYQEHPIVAGRSDEEVNELRRIHDIEVLNGTIVSADGVKDVPKPITTFEEASFPEWILSRLSMIGFKDPTAIQIQVWPVALQGRDLIGIAETGSGKTVAYVLPMLVHIVAQEELKPGEGPVGVVLCPTRELTIQIDEVVRDFSGLSGIKSVAIYGGGDVKQQGARLQDKNDVVVACPGRFIQLLNDGYSNLNRVTYVVLDEADEMLNESFGEQIELILGQVRPERQMLMFSATWKKDVQTLARAYCTASEGMEPVMIRVGRDKLAVCRNVKQQVLACENYEDKYQALVKAIRRSKCDKNGSQHKCLVFARSQKTVDDIVWRLQSEDHMEVEGMHAGKKMTDRLWVLHELRHGHLSCVISTACLGRGHDISRVRYVINFDAPETIEDYIHRVGRTGRAGETGFAMTFMTPRDVQLADPLVMILESIGQQVEPKLQEMASQARGTWTTNEAWGDYKDESGAPSAWGRYKPATSEEEKPVQIQTADQWHTNPQEAEPENPFS
ncbi:unnamed protein product [Polarella glacialis]|uniref:RNA helicase n=1 Tax=Polarella glacialis TaxID=89957 RepID=A0A813F5M0_POLGL|nr:unnamed protein product [Polarella glacialis]